MSEPPAERRHLSYQPGLDGLRAVAVLTVMLYHFGVRRFRGGLLGVDLFFVLSGFLITTLLLREHEGSGRINFGDFYSRRIRRLFPALLLVLGGVLIQQHLTHTVPLISREVRKDSLASLFYVANWWFTYSKLSYFAQFGAPLPLRHVWSLAVEEQWYLVWPLVLVALLRITRRRLEIVLGVVLGLAVLSAVWMSALVEPLGDPSRAYYGTDTRAQTLLVGAALAIILQRWPLRKIASTRAVQAAGGVGLVGCLIVLTTVEGFDDHLYRGGFLLFAVGGALIVAGVMANEKGYLARLLSIPPLPWIGRISYGLYLWHWPVAVWINPIDGRYSGWSLLVVRSVVSFGAAIASYYLVERPIRTAAWQRLRWPRLTTAAAMGAASVALTLCIAVPVSPRTFAATPKSRPVATPRPPDRPDDLKVLLVGDSVAWSLGFGVPKQAGLHLSTAAALGCGILPGKMINNGVIHIETGVPPCATERERWAASVKDRQPDVVVFGYGAWEVYDHVFGTSVYKVFTDRYRQELSRALLSDIEYVRTLTSAPIVFLNAPCMRQRSYEVGEQPDPRNSKARRTWINGVLRDVVASRTDSVAILDWSSFLCPDGKFQEKKDGIVVRPDGVHFDQTSAHLAWEWLGPRLRTLAEKLGPADDGTSASGS